MKTCCNDGKRMTPYSEFVSTTPALPSFYWDVYSSEQRIKEMCKELCKLVDYANELGVYTSADRERIDELYAEFEQFKDSGFADYYEQLLQKWIDENQRAIYEHLAKQVFFGLTDDGYFCAYVPESWSDITFDTGAVYGRADYGRLILRFTVDGSGVIDNTYDNNNFDYDELKELKAQVNTLNQQVMTALSKVG